MSAVLEILTQPGAPAKLLALAMTRTSLCLRRCSRGRQSLKEGGVLTEPCRPKANNSVSHIPAGGKLGPNSLSGQPRMHQCVAGLGTQAQPRGHPLSIHGAYHVVLLIARPVRVAEVISAGAVRKKRRMVHQAEHTLGKTTALSASGPGRRRYETTTAKALSA